MYISSRFKNRNIYNDVFYVELHMQAGIHVPITLPLSSYPNKQRKYRYRIEVKSLKIPKHKQ